MFFKKDLFQIIKPFKFSLKKETFVRVAQFRDDSTPRANRSCI